MRVVDAVIVGQGIAGSTLAWTLQQQGRSVLIVDRGEKVTASRIAAGLMTPVTGPRLVLFPRYRMFFAAAELFYRQVSRKVGVDLLTRRHSLRLFSSAAERELFVRKQQELAEVLISDQPTISSDWFHAEHGGFEMQGGQLDVPTYLELTRSCFRTQGRLLIDSVDPVVDVAIEERVETKREDMSVRLPRLGIVSRRLVFCEGVSGLQNRWFPKAGFNPAKGEILTVRIEGFDEARIVHRGLWIAPCGDGMYRVGATYDWKLLNQEPTLEGRDELLRRLKQLLRLPVKVVDQSAAVRPTTHDTRPSIGFHSQHPKIGFFNGLGSRGSLLAPYYADQFARTMFDCDEMHALDSDVRIDRWNL